MMLGAEQTAGREHRRVAAQRRLLIVVYPAAIPETRGDETMTTFSTKISIDGPSCDLHIAGDVDIASAGALTEIGLLCLHTEAVRSLVVDLGAVTFLDSTGIGALIVLRNESIELGTDLRLRDLPERVRKVLEITGLTSVFSLCEANDPTTDARLDGAGMLKAEEPKQDPTAHNVAQRVGVSS
jgi:anti-anti-sigma factor